jgi:hypothetical protein
MKRTATQWEDASFLPSSKIIRRRTTRNNTIIEECIQQLPCELLHVILQFAIIHKSTTETFNSCMTQNRKEHCSKFIRMYYIRFKHDENRNLFLVPVELRMNVTNNVFLPVPIGIKKVTLNWLRNTQDVLKKDIPAQMGHVSQIHLLIYFSNQMKFLLETSDPSILQYYAQRVTVITFFRVLDIGVISLFPHLRTITALEVVMKRSYFQYLTNCTTLTISVDNLYVDELFTLKNLKKLTLLQPVADAISDPTSDFVPNNDIEQLTVKFNSTIPTRFAKGLRLLELKRLTVNLHNPLESTFSSLNLLPKITQLILDVRNCFFIVKAKCGRDLAAVTIDQLKITTDVKITDDFYSAISTTTTIKKISLHMDISSQDSSGTQRIRDLLIGNNSFEKVKIIFQSTKFSTYAIIEKLKQILPRCSSIKFMKLCIPNGSHLEIVIGNCTVSTVSNSK